MTHDAYDALAMERADSVPGLVADLGRTYGHKALGIEP